jgi:hypothetical protein|nr:MAG TPA: Glycine rich protein family [Caudoviricetes sp.]
MEYTIILGFGFLLGVASMLGSSYIARNEEEKRGEE